ncbi:MAG: efflux RND transporter periplasmic adaptor subunit [Verrucomicrobiota bacterium]|nr:efflux RND transporter periplasmic adaptor subunit [Limisphaera sp.]MDW8382467.1 efflux RND transporter periplasmic adaptor subunit [Verrucomicrobiota bacterium]
MKKAIRDLGWRLLPAGVMLAGMCLVGWGCARPVQEDTSLMKSPDASAESGGQRCLRHQAPSPLCFMCNPELRDRNRLWCSAHERYEDRCWWCHPELRESARPFCDLHGLYKDECFLCQPALRRAEGVAGEGGASALAAICREHNVAEAECGICRPEMIRDLSAGRSLKVRLPAADSAGLVGLVTTEPKKTTVHDWIECPAEVVFDPNRVARIVAPVEGIAQQVLVSWDSTVRSNQVLVRLWSAPMAEAVTRAILTYQTLVRERRLREARVSATRELEQAEAEHLAACHYAQTFGFTEEQIHRLASEGEPPVYLELRAPLSGELLERTVVQGARVHAGETLMTLVDRSVMLARLHVPEEAATRLRPGLSVELRLEAWPERIFHGRLIWISPQVEERSRLVPVMAEVANPEGLLRAWMFARAHVVIGQANDALLVPEAAVQWVEGRPVVFVKVTDDLYEARVLQLGLRSGGWCQVVEGLAPHEPVVVQGAFAVKSQLLLSRLGAACVED